MLRSTQHRLRPMDLGPAREPIEANLKTLPEITWIQPIPDRLVASGPGPEESAMARESVRLPLVAAPHRLAAQHRAGAPRFGAADRGAAAAAAVPDTSLA